MEHKQSLEHSSLPLLSLLRDQDRYGYEMISELERRSDHTFQMKEGTLYPVLKKLEASRPTRRKPMAAPGNITTSPNGALSSWPRKPPPGSDTSTASTRFWGPRRDNPPFPKQKR